MQDTFQRQSDSWVDVNFFLIPDALTRKQAELLKYNKISLTRTVAINRNNP